ncbi:hypothetical protein [Gracilimonas sediminicola]|uniref:Uncharacterized protein n=1 Tax=Gracilimonas sediminicola TaxID=2952158 RepID=A0A9X2RAW3_9BACT|nr:hypothetical protein [Gracilimonas sediminicola]MCP9290020.1 hypothetical protein [Gracilimonas sediminicola]
MPDLALHPTKGKIEKRDPLNINEAVIKSDKEFLDSPEMEKLAKQIMEEKSIEGHEEAKRLHDTIQATASSLYDMDPKQEDQISLF